MCPPEVQEAESKPEWKSHNGELEKDRDRKPARKNKHAQKWSKPVDLMAETSTKNQAKRDCSRRLRVTQHDLQARRRFGGIFWQDGVEHTNL